MVFRSTADLLTDCATLITEVDIAVNTPGINWFPEKPLSLSLSRIEADKIASK